MRCIRLGSLVLIVILVLFGYSKGNDIGWKASSKNGVVAAGDPRSVAAGIKILEMGGNAADAAVATILALSVTDFGAFCIGGEVPLMIYDAEQKEVKVLSGQGAAPLDTNAIQWYYKHGIPYEDIKAAAVPAVIDLCVTTLKVYGTKTFVEVVDPTLDILKTNGEEWYPDLAHTFYKLIQAENQKTGKRSEKLQAVSDRFYRGDIADDLELWYIEKEGFLRKKDLANHTTRIEDPISINYRGYTVYKCNTWTQGPVLCQTLGLLESYDLKKMGHLSADYIHVITEAFKLGFADRDAYFADPLFVDVPLDALLSETYLKLRRSLIDMDNASKKIIPGDPVKMKRRKNEGGYQPGLGGTTTCCVADRWGNVVAATPSGWGSEAGSGGSTGITHGTRLLSLNTTPGHPNRIERGKRPRITLTPSIVLKDSRPILAISVVGGDIQDQTTLNLILDFIEFNMMPDQAVTEPRFRTGHHEDSFNPHTDRTQAYEGLNYLEINSGISNDVKNALTKRGHDIEETTSAIGDPVMIYIDHATNILKAAGDPNAGRHAAGLE